jgi:hypothetical protein
VESAQGVTWAISPDDHSGTALTADGKLTIAETEAVNSTFTVTATSTTDNTKTGSVTVTVTSKAALPLPASVTLSDQGVATWTASSPETNVVSYSVQLYKDTSTVGAAQTVTKGGTYLVNFLSAMRDGGVGSYTVKVKAVGDGEAYADSPEAESAARNVSQKTTVAHVWWFETTRARWVNVDEDSNYAVQLYRDGTPVGGPVAVPRENTQDPGNAVQTVTTHDFTGAISTGGHGSYTFGVVTKGDGYLALDAVETVSEAYENNILPAPTGLAWSGTTAQWNAVTGAAGYSVQLYKNGSLEGTVVTVTTETSYAGFDVSASGLYTFTVKALGNGDTILDSAPANSADTEGDAGKYSAGATASITLSAANESGRLTVTPAEPVSIGKTGTTTSVALAVEGTGFSGFTWIVDGNTITTSGNGITLSGANNNTLTIDATDGAVKLGGHSVTVYALDEDSLPWSPESAVKFTVTR